MRRLFCDSSCGFSEEVNSLFSQCSHNIIQESYSKHLCVYDACVVSLVTFNNKLCFQEPNDLTLSEQKFKISLVLPHSP